MPLLCSISRPSTSVTTNLIISDRSPLDMEREKFLTEGFGSTETENLAASISSEPCPDFVIDELTTQLPNTSQCDRWASKAFVLMHRVVPLWHTLTLLFQQRGSVKVLVVVPIGKKEPLDKPEV